MKRFIMLGTVIFGSTFVEGADLIETVDPTTPTSPTTSQKLKRLEEIRKPDPSTDIERPATVSPAAVSSDNIMLVDLRPVKLPHNSPKVSSPLALAPKTAQTPLKE